MERAGTEKDCASDAGNADCKGGCKVDGDSDAQPETDVAWLGHGLESLVARFPHIDSHADARSDVDFDLVIVGSGYGAAVAAHEFAGCRPEGEPGARPLSICILERGLEYLSGAFPSRMSDLAGHLRFSTEGLPKPRGIRTGLFDVRVGGDVMAVMASGVGGGSLINAGVMLEPSPEVFKSCTWPKALRQTDLAVHYQQVRQFLRVDSREEPTSADGTEFENLAKTKNLFALAQKGDGQFEHAQYVPITVALQENMSSYAGVPLDKCIKCGDCATGCNHNAKNSLDMGLLAVACATPGVSLYTGATVLRIQKMWDCAGWGVVVNHTDDKLRQRQRYPFVLRAKRVILAAGTFGSTEILLRSRRHDGDERSGPDDCDDLESVARHSPGASPKGLKFSSKLGRQLSANGDLLASIHGQDRRVNAVANEDEPPASREVGPTITAMIDLRKDHGFVIQDLAVPGPMRRAFEEIFTTSDTLRALQQRDRKTHTPGDIDQCAVDRKVIDNSLPIAMIGHDSSDGSMRLIRSIDSDHRGRVLGDVQNEEGDGALQIVWPQLRDDPRWPSQHEKLASMLESSRLGGRVLPNPFWQLLTADMQQSLDVPNGPLVTVHPLGGCPMGDDVRSGVVDDIGRVFDATDPTAKPHLIHDGLVVLDGSIVPASLGINPSLTIAALAHRACAPLRTAWGLAKAQPNTAPRGARPIFRKLGTPVAPQKTRVELLERMRGTARLDWGRQRWVELTLYSQATELRSLMTPTGPRQMTFDGDRSKLRILSTEPSLLTNEPVDKGEVLFEAKLNGNLTIFQRERTWSFWRTLRAGFAWLINRGIRDTLQWFFSPARSKTPTVERIKGNRITDAIALASRAGQVRRLDYELTVGDIVEENISTSRDSEAARKNLADKFAKGTCVSGCKRLTYGRASNPLEQLMKMSLTHFPGLSIWPDPVLELDLTFLADQAVPLMRVVGQEDQPTALMDYASFLAYVSRILIDGNLWAFRKPDPPSDRTPRRLPGFVPGAPGPHIVELEVARVNKFDAEADHGKTQPVHIRLARYCPQDVNEDLPPIMMIHGYSASGTTFAHPTIKPCLMKVLTMDHKRDVWILDMRSSCGMPTATHDWSFEDMGCEDIPLAVQHICDVTGKEQIDIVAHCMGSAMLFMGLLGHTEKHRRDPLPKLSEHEALRERLWSEGGKGRIRRLVMSQVGPALKLTPGNITRAYLMRYMKQFIADGRYEFRPEANPGLAGQLMDRVLAAMPYPKGEFQRENPPWGGFGKYLTWVGTRHRIDALFGRVFNLSHMTDETLEAIDDFFGPFSVETVSQVMHFVRYSLITDRNGFSRFVDVKRMRERLTFPILSLHSRENGLVDVCTKDLLQQVFGAGNLGKGGSLDAIKLDDCTLGHQDSLIGSEEATRQPFEKIAAFLNQ